MFTRCNFFCKLNQKLLNSLETSSHFETNFFRKNRPKHVGFHTQRTQFGYERHFSETLQLKVVPPFCIDSFREREQKQKQKKNPEKYDSFLGYIFKVDQACS